MDKDSESALLLSDHSPHESGPLCGESSNSDLIHENTRVMSEVKSAITDLASAIQGLFEGAQPKRASVELRETANEDPSDSLSVSGSAYSFVAMPEEKSSESQPRPAKLARIPEPSLGSLFDQPASTKQDHVSRLIDHTTEAPNLDFEEETLGFVDGDKPISIEKGEPISAKLAEKIEQYWQKYATQRELLSSILKKHKLPSNLSNIVVPSMPSDVFKMKSLKDNQIRNEKKLFATQQILVKITSILATICNSLLHADKTNVTVDIKQVISDAFDAITLVSHCALEIGNRRKANVRNSFDPEIRDICNASTGQFGTSLFGEDFHKIVKEAKEVAKISHIAERSRQDSAIPRYGNRVNQQANRPSVQQRSHFLGRGRKFGPGPPQARRRSHFQN